jgi:hypothetical protein
MRWSGVQEIGFCEGRLFPVWRGKKERLLGIDKKGEIRMWWVPAGDFNLWGRFCENIEQLGL